MPELTQKRARKDLNEIPREVLAAALSRRPHNVTTSGCHEWTGSVSTNGYGRVSVAGGRYQAHRAAWVCRYGPAPAHLFACHKCDNRRCVNAEHIFLGTPADNMRDASAKRRLFLQRFPEKAKRGEAHIAAKLSANEAREIAASKESTYDLSIRYGVTATTIGRIKAKKLWTSETGDIRFERPPFRGENVKQSKLNDAAIPQIFVLRGNGETIQRIADRFCVSRATILNVLNRRHWSHVDCAAAIRAMKEE